MLRDTSPAAQLVYEKAIERLTPDERIAITMEMIAVTDDLIRAGIRLRHPAASGEEFEYLLLRAKYGPELAGRVHGRPW